jgi:hypothetical protein
MGQNFRGFDMRKTIFAAASLAALMSPVVASADDYNRCLRVGYVHNWDVQNDKTLIVEDEWRQKYRVDLMGYCSNLPWHERLAFRSIGGTELSCLGPGDEVITREFGTGVQRCVIRHITPYTKEMEAADKAAKAAHDQDRDDHDHGDHDHN